MTIPWLLNVYPWTTAFHLIAVIAWMAGLFYLPRLFVYHAMCDDRPGLDRFKVMERKLYWGMATPCAVLALVFGVLLPTISLPGLGIANGFRGNGPLQLTDPSLDLKRNLNQPTNRVVFRYTTDRPGGVYLRMAALPQFSASGFGNTQIRLNTGANLSEPPGFTGTPPALRPTS